MNNAKICAALKQTNELGNSLPSGCVIAQLFLGAGKTEYEVEEERYICDHYSKMFDHFLSLEYDLTETEVDQMVIFNASCLPNGNYDKKERHTRVLAKYCN